MTILNHTLGFPRVGLRRELKKAQESYWAGNSTREELLAVGRELRARHWDQQKQAGIDLLPVGDFAWYDHVLTTSLLLGNVEATAEQIAVWLRKEDEEGFQRCPDIVLSSFLNGLIYEKRGKDESAPALEPERRINNNIVLKKLRIAFSLKTDDILAILTEQQFRVSMPEITAMMRAPDHKNFRECGDQFLRYFLRGLAARQHVKKS